MSAERTVWDMRSQALRSCEKRRREIVALLRWAFREYCDAHAAAPRHTDVIGLYSGNAHYLRATTEWECSRRKQALYHALDSDTLFGARHEVRVADLGCASGNTGIELLMQGYGHVDFVDFEGLALQYLRKALPTVAEFAGRYSIVPYGEEREVDVVVAADVIERVRDHLGFVRWATGLARRGVVLTYPLTQSFCPPYDTTVVDGWVDDEMMRAALERHGEIADWSEIESGRQVILLRARDAGPRPAEETP